MAKVTQYAENVAVPMPQTRGGTVDAGALGPPRAGLHAFDTLAQNVDRGTSIMMQKEEEQARAWSSTALSKARLDWTTQLIQRQSDPEHNKDGAANFTPNILKDYDDYASKAIEGAPDNPSRRFLTERFADLRSDLGSKAMVYEAKARIDWRIDQHKKAGEYTAALVAQDDSQYKVGLAEQLTLVDASAMPQEQKSAVRDWMVNKVSGAAVWGQIQRSPTGFLKSIGFYGDEPGQSGGKMRKTAGDFNAVTGNQPWDVLPYDAKVKMFEQAIRAKAQMDIDADRAVMARSKQMEADAFKEVLNRAFPPTPDAPKLTRDFIESQRSALSKDDYKAALTMLVHPEQRTDPVAFAQVERLVYGKQLDEARTTAYNLHAAGRLSNDNLGSALSRIEQFAHQGGPHTPYERGREYVNKSLNPGENNYDPVRNQRLADALREYDNYALQNPKAPDSEIQERSKQIVNQYRLVQFKDDSLNLPIPRGVSIRRTNNPQALSQDISAAALQIDRDYSSGKIKEQEYKARLATLKPWKDMLDQIQGSHK